MGPIVLKLEKQKECFEISTDHMRGRPLRICRRRAAMTCNGHSNFQTIHRICVLHLSNSHHTLTLDQMVFNYQISISQINIPYFVLGIQTLDSDTFPHTVDSYDSGQNEQDFCLF